MQQYSEAGPGIVLGDCSGSVWGYQVVLGINVRPVLSPLRSFSELGSGVSFGQMRSMSQSSLLVKCSPVNVPGTYRVGKLDLILLFCFWGHTKQ